MVNYNTRHSADLEQKSDTEPVYQDLTLYIVYDHRQGTGLEELAQRLVSTTFDDSCFMQMA